MPRRKSDQQPDLPRPRGLFRHHRQYRARRSHAHAWEYFGTDYAEAMKGYAAWKRHGGTGQQRDTVDWLMDLFTGSVCPKKVRAGELAPRTAADYSKDAAFIKQDLGHFPLDKVRPADIVIWRDVLAETQPRHVRNVLACLSAAFAYAVSVGKMASNPCREVDRPSKKRRERLISHDEYLRAWDSAGAQVRRAMLLCMRTLANPSDALMMGPRNLLRGPDGARILRFRRGKTRILVEVAVVGELAQLIEEHLAADVVRATFVHRRDGKPFTVWGIGAMFRRACVGTKERPREDKIDDFGLRDLRAKGATDMYRTDPNNIRQIQLLLGHKSVQTTEIYLKELVPQLVRPNETVIIAEAK